MISPELQRRASKTIRTLELTGIQVLPGKALANGIQIHLEKDGATCRLNLYYSTKKGYSIIPSGGDSFLIESASAMLTGKAKSDTESRIGSDEAGKGEYIGPLVVCAVYTTSGTAGELRKYGTTDSKCLTDSSVKKTAVVCMDYLGDAFAPVVISPADYNRRFAELQSQGKNSLDMLASAHGEAICSLIDRGYTPDKIVIDRFCPRKRLDPFLPECKAEIEIRPRAEDDPAVATASVIARFLYLSELERLERETGISLVSGSGQKADLSVRKLVKSFGTDILEKTVKIHFRIT